MIIGSEGNAVGITILYFYIIYIFRILYIRPDESGRYSQYRLR